MVDYTLYSTVKEKQRNLTLWFVFSGLVATTLIVVLIAASGYYLLRTYGLQSKVDAVSLEIENLRLPNFEQPVVPPGVDTRIPTVARLVPVLGTKIQELKYVESVALFGRNGERLWQSQPGISLAPSERIDYRDIYSGVRKQKIYDLNFLEADSWVAVLVGVSSKVATLVRVQPPNSDLVLIAKLKLDFQAEIEGARDFGLRMFMFVMLGNLILFFILYYYFRNGVKTIEQQEEKLNQQISRLSNLLTINKNMQQSMKTASARAVELNEQFLRRVGADLHDGPAQMIGYAVLRLNQISQKEIAKEFGHEFHAIREALDESLDEIRGISSGLVLPELESMSLEQCLRKVVALHGVQSNSEVAQYYTDIDSHIPLPIKIMAYRFVQEGLNNSHRHGQAEKCRITAQVKEGVLHLSLKDNGMGFRVSQLNTKGGHLGLLGLKDRVESLGGKFSINSELGIGTALKVSISLLDDDIAESR